MADYWKRFAVFSIYKGKGDRLCILNYHFISFTLAISRVFELVLLQIIEHVLKRVIYEHKFGFRAGISNKSNLFFFLLCNRHINTWFLCNCRYRVSWSCKSFNKVDYLFLVNKLLNYYIILSVVFVLIEFLVNRF